MRLNTRILTSAGLLIAMSVLLTRFASFMVAGNAIRVTFGTIPIYVAGILFGPFVGGLVGGISDVLGYPLNPFAAAFNPIIFVAFVLRGVIPPLVFRVLGNNNRALQIKIAAAILVTELICGAGLTTFGLTFILKLPFISLLPLRLLAIAIQLPVYVIVTYALTVALRSSRASQQVGG